MITNRGRFKTAADCALIWPMDVNLNQLFKMYSIAIIYFNPDFVLK